MSLTFDDGIDNQYSLGFKRALQPHGMRGTFFIITNFPNVNSDSMTWSQVTALNQGGNEIGAHTMNHVNLKTTTDYQTKVNEVCGSRQALLDHGFYPASFAYPEGAYDATAESIVQGCGFTSGRAAGGIDVAGDGAGPLYAEGLPPTDRFATKTVYDPPTGTPLNVPPLGLSHMEAAINGAAQHGGGWIQLVFHQVCSQTYDPDNYDACMADWGPIDLPTLNGLLDWLQSAGQPGGAPPRTVVQTVSQVIDGPDTQPPVTQLLCNGAPCQSSMYSGSVDLALSATDPGGSGAAATYYTTDGSTPTSSSPTFSTPFIITRSETLTFYSVDNAGNAEQVRTITVLDQPHADPVVGAAGDIACDPTAPAFNGGDGTATDCRAKATGNLMTGVDAVLPLGDTQYDCGGMSAYLQSYDPAWGRFKPISHPVPGDKEYDSTGTGCPSTPGADYFSYFGASAGDPSRGLLQLRPRVVARDRAQHRAVSLEPCFLRLGKRAGAVAAAGSRCEQRQLYARLLPEPEVLVHVWRGQHGLPTLLAGPVRRGGVCGPQRRFALVRTIRADGRLRQCLDGRDAGVHRRDRRSRPGHAVIAARHERGVEREHARSLEAGPASGQLRLVIRARQRRHLHRQWERPMSGAAGQGRAAHHDQLQRWLVRGHVLGGRLRGARADRYGRLRRRQDLLHPRREHPDDLEHGVHGTVLCARDDHGQVLLHRCGGQR